MHDTEQLGTLLAGLGPRLEAVALRITRHPEHARDVVQNAFEKVLRHGARFQGESKVSTWIHRIVTNEALMWLRSQRRRGEVQADGDLLDGPEAPRIDSGPAEHTQRRENVRELQRGLRSLSEDERDVILRCALAEESYAAYGSRTGVHPAAVKSRAFRARRHLGELLAETVH
jgi:RNA polymerase sigma-70 factor (ECF subfamily)